MSNWLIVVIAAILQGVTEFLPVSSSGHLALLSGIFKLNADVGTAFSIILHAGSLLAITVYYFKTLLGFFKRDQLHLLKMVIIGSIPAGIIGILLKKTGLIEIFFGDMLSVAMGLLITASILRLTTKEKLRAKGECELKEISLRQAITIGLAQAAAIIPGISRSGTTIAASILSGVKFEAAAAFSFLLAIPAIGGAALLEIVDLTQKGFEIGDLSITQLVTGFIISSLASFFALKLLVNLIKKRKLAWFSWYLFFIGSAVMLWQIIKLSKGGSGI